jgi:hypothetical protein
MQTRTRGNVPLPDGLHPGVQGRAERQGRFRGRQRAQTEHDRCIARAGAAVPCCGESRSRQRPAKSVSTPAKGRTIQMESPPWRGTRQFSSAGACSARVSGSIGASIAGCSLFERFRTSCCRAARGHLRGQLAHRLGAGGEHPPYFRGEFGLDGCHGSCPREVLCRAPNAEHARYARYAWRHPLLDHSVPLAPREVLWNPRP